jgi:hypothetical protein
MATPAVHGESSRHVMLRGVNHLADAVMVYYRLNMLTISLVPSGPRESIA